jgi:hypothetical protein
MRRSTVVLGWLSCVLLATDASAQARAIGAPPGQGQGVGGFATPVDRNGVLAIEPFEVARPVKGTPYTAQAITETTQVLADGNRIGRRTAATVARDSHGRIRREQQALVLGGVVIGNDVPLVTITDPASRTHVTLDPQRRVASRVRTPALADGSRGGPAGQAGPGLSVGPARTPGLRDGADVQTVPLAARRIEGLQAEGTRTTMTIPAHAIGNQSAIIIVSERWFSPDLQVVLLTRRSDPRFGETVYRLVNIVRVEPAAELFQVPTDYRIEEQTLPPPLPPPSPLQR